MDSDLIIPEVVSTSVAGISTTIVLPIGVYLSAFIISVYIPNDIVSSLLLAISEL